MKKPSAGLVLGALVVLVTMALTGATGGQTAVRASAAAAPPKYNTAKEIGIEGTVASIITDPTPGMLAGAHVLLATASGILDAHLGNYAMKGTSALRLSSGEQVRMVGVIVTIKGGPVLLVRMAQTAGGTYIVRNAHGILVRSGPACATRPQKNTRGGRS